MDGPPVEEIVELLDDVVDRIAATLAAHHDWGLAGTRAGQHHSDLAADDAAVAALLAGGVGVLSEESGRHAPERPVTVVVDPLDGSTNAAHGIPWYAASVCAVDADGPVVAVVLDLVHDRRFRAVRGGGATRDGTPISPSTVRRLSDALVGLSGLPPEPLGWRQFRALGAVALDLCGVADGTLDGFVDCSADAHGPWDYLGGKLVCDEAGAVVTDATGRDLVALDHRLRRTPVAAGTAALHTQLVEARSTF